jgi:preprotein translocase subunit SecG
LLITIHVLSCIMLILVVLLQAGRGADMGAAFGGASTPMFGSGSSTNPLARVTTVTAVAFLATALVLAVSSARRASVFDSASEPLASPPRAESSAPAAAAAPAGAPVGEAKPLTIPAAPGNAAPAASDEAPGVAASDNPVEKESAPAQAAPSAVPAPAAAAAPSPAPAAQPETAPATPPAP